VLAPTTGHTACNIISLAIIMAIFPGEPGLAGIRNVSILDFIGTKDDGGGGDNWSYKTCKTPVKS